MSKPEGKFNFSDDLFDQTNKVDTDLGNLGNEVSKVQQVFSKQSRIHEKFSKSCIIQKEKKNFEHFDSYMRELHEFSRSVSQIQNNFVKSCLIQVQSLDRLKKFLDDSRRDSKQRQLNNEKIYFKKKKMLENIKRKQHKHGKEAHERYVKHDKLCRDDSLDGNVLDESELRFIHAAKMEEKYSQQYQDVFRYHQDYLDNYIRENREILGQSEEYYLLVMKNMRAHCLRFVEDQEEIIVGMRKGKYYFRQTNFSPRYVGMVRLKRNLEAIEPEERVQRYIQVNKRKKIELDEKHNYEPFIPIYKMGEIERERELKKIETQEIPSEQHSRLTNLFSGMFGRARKSQMTQGTPENKMEKGEKPKKSQVGGVKERENTGRKRRGTQKVYNSVVRSPRIVNRSVLPAEDGEDEKTESQLFYESLYDEIVGVGVTSKIKKPSFEEEVDPVARNNEEEGENEMEEKEEEGKKKKGSGEEEEEEEEVEKKSSSEDPSTVFPRKKKVEAKAKGISEAKKKKALGWLEMVDGRRGLVSALNLKRNLPYIEDFDKFDFLGQLISKCLQLSHKKQDSGVGSNLLNMTQTFYTIKNENQLFYFKHLNKMEIWKNIRFWEACFYDLMTNMRKRSMHYQERWRDMDEVRRKEVRKEHANMTYGILTSFIFSMMESEVESTKVRNFVVKMCEINGLDTEQVNLIMQGYETMLMMKKKSKN